MNYNHIIHELEQACKGNATVEYVKKSSDGTPGYFRISSKEGMPNLYETDVDREIDNIAKKYDLAYDEDCGVLIELYFR